MKKFLLSFLICCAFWGNNNPVSAQLEDYGVCGTNEELLSKSLNKKLPGVFSITPNPAGINFKAAALYFKAANDTFMALSPGYSDSLRCSVAQWPADSTKPNWFGHLLIPTPFDSNTVESDTANYPYSITTYFYQMSNGNLWLYGNEVVYDGPSINKADNATTWRSNNADIHEWLLNEMSEASLDSLDNDSNSYVDLIIFINRLRYKPGYQGVANGVYLPSGNISASDPNKPEFRRSTSLSYNSGVYQHQVWSLGDRNIICHEIGHQLRLGGHENGLNRWNLMSGAGPNGGTPPSESGIVMSAWERYDLSWLSFEDIAVDSINFKLPSLTKSGKAIRIPYDTNDYFIIENRQNEIRFEDVYSDSCSYLVSELAEGLLISNSDDADFPEIIPADDTVAVSGGAEDGDATDLFPNGGVTSLTPYTTPSTNVGSTETHKAITNIHYSGDTLVFNIYQNYWGDEINSNTTWTSTESPYYVGEDLTIASGVTLTISEGTLVTMAPNTRILVGGTLTVNGSSSNEVTFTRKTDSGNWNYIRFNSGGSGTISHAVIEYPDKGIYSFSDNVTIENSTIREFTQQAIYADECDITVDSCVVENPDGASHGVYLLESDDPTITGNEISDIGGAGIYIEHGDGTISGNTIQDCNIGIQCYLTSAEIYNNYFDGNNTGIRLYSAASLDIHDNNFYNGSIGLYLDQSQPTDVKWNNFGWNGSIQAHDDEGIYVDYLTTNSFLDGKYNNFYDGDITKDITNSTATTLDATGNYWESVSYTGPVDASSPEGSYNSDAGPIGALGKHKKTELTSNQSLPEQFKLEQNYPNPFNPSTVIAFHLPNESSVDIVIYDMLGRIVRSLTHDTVYQPGIHKLTWNGKNNADTMLTSGVYFYTIKATSTENSTVNHQTKKLVLIQ